ncbi:histidine phosphatase superfamily [Phycomyces blakesleeanus]|uniref:Histidine phosphatase superfamily n=1 Tax=Phycomyces blakesleeanus TaxID=4837 RepID=A0ABR3B838_PHYBL
MSAKLPELDAHYPKDLKLKLLQVVHRHGERTPVRRRLEHMFPPIWNMCDTNRQLMSTITSMDGLDAKSQVIGIERIVDRPHQFTADNACYYGQLTNLGRNSMSLLGTRLREIYVDKLGFLPDRYDEKTIYIRSSDYPRTQESVQQLVAGGLYPPTKREDDFKLKLRIRDPRDDNMFPNPNCRKLRTLAKEFNKTVSVLCKDELEIVSDQLKPYVDTVSLSSHPSANGVLDTLISAKTHGFSLPATVTDDVLQRLEAVVVKEWFYGAMESPVVRRLGMGRLMGDIRDRMVNRATRLDKDTPEADHQLAIYSGHDTTVGPLLIILNGFDERWPPFGSSVIFELFEKETAKWFGTKTEHFVRVRYNDKLLELPGCAGSGDHLAEDKSICTLEAFQKIVKDSIPEDWEQECNQ